MGNWVRRLLRLSSGQAEADRVQTQRMAAPLAATNLPPVPNGIAAWCLPTEIDALFFDSLSGNLHARDAGNPHAEKVVLDALERHSQSRSNSADLIPRVPTVIPHLLQSLRDENISGRELAKEITRDITLVSEVLRQANSSFYNQREPVTSIEHALLVLGKNTLRLLIAKAAFRPLIHSQSGRFTRIAAPYLWDQSDKGAFACRILAQQENVDPFTAFLAGLMQNVGMILAFRLADQTYDGAALPTAEHFRRQFLRHARRLSALTAAQWDLPPAIRQVLDALDTPEAGHPNATLVQVVHAGDQLSKLRILINQGHLPDQGATLTSGLPPLALDCLQQMNQFTE